MSLRANSLFGKRSNPMDTNDPPRRVLPKRKRKETSYFPTDSEDSDVELEETGDNGVGDGTSLHNKKVKLSAPSKPAKPLLKKQIFPFTSLPPELKNKIYEYVLTSEHEVPIVWKLRQYRHIAVLGDTDSFQAFLRRGRYSYLSKPAKQVQTPSFGPSILRLNRQFYAETLPILYGANTFAFENTHAMLAFCACIKPKNCALLRQVSLKHMGYSKGTKALNNPGFAQLASAVNLTRLIMDCSIHYSGRGDQIARQFYRDAHHWLEAVASNKGRRDAAVEIVELGVENVRYYGYTSDNEDASRAKLLAITASFHDELRRMLLQA